jgi:hypothetical protein
MRKLVALPVLVVSIVLVSAQASAATSSTTPAVAKRASEPATQSQLFKTLSNPASNNNSPNKGLTFQVNDEKGLLLTCVAPQIETNPDTDIFHSCALAPGRTLDDVMHTFIQGIHYEQDQHQKERAEWERDLEEKPAQKSVPK